ncbi:hypothetical protein K2227_17360 [Shewanella putrefaciens]|nr:hypothetical protein K2227_17360 [Shewanella putrefaciens]
MVNLSTLFAVKDGGSLTAEQTKSIDSVLALASSADIPDEQVENVVDYLDCNLFANRAAIPAEQFIALEKLRSELEARR